MSAVLFAAMVFASLISWGRGLDMRWVLVLALAAAILLMRGIRLFRNREILIDRIDVGLGVFTAYAALSLTWSPDPLHGALFLLCWLPLWVIFTYIKNAPAQTDRQHLLLAVSAAAATVMVLHYALPGKWSGFFNENFVTEFLLLSLPFVIGATALRWQSVWQRGLGIALSGWILFYLFWQNNSKIEFLVLPVVAGLFGLIWLRQRSRRIALLLAVAVPLGLATTVWMMWGGQNGYGGSLTPRLAFWYDTLHMWWQHPLLGNGAGSFAYLFPDFQDKHLAIFPDFDLATQGAANAARTLFAGAAHNDYLQFLNDFGLIGIAIGLWLAFETLRLLKRQFDMSPELLVGLAGLVVVMTNSMIEFPLQNAATALLSIISAGLVLHGLPVAHRRIEVSKAMSGVLATAILLLAGFTGYAAWRMDSAQREYRLAVVFYGMDPAIAFDHALTANRLNPFDWFTRIQLNETLLQWNRVAGNPPLSPEEYDKVYEISRSAGPQGLLLIRRLQYLLDTHRYEEKREEVETTLAYLKKHFSRNADVWIADAYYDLLSGQPTAARSSLDQASALPLNPEQQQQVAGLQNALEHGGL